jgi:hypothetical protein
MADSLIQKFATALSSVVSLYIGIMPQKSHYSLCLFHFNTKLKCTELVSFMS